VKEIKTTFLQTDWMYLINTQQQLMRLGLRTRYPNERLEEPPKKLDLLIFSYSKQALYTQGKAPTLKINTDGALWNIEARAYILFQGETKDGQDIFWGVKRTDIGQPSDLSKDALVKGKEGINDLFLEQVFFELTPQQLAKLAHATKASLQLGPTGVEFSQTYLATIRDFSGRLVPGAQPTAEGNPAATSGATQDSEAQNDIGVVNGKAIRLPTPPYPSLAKSSGASGGVKVFVTIDETGKVIAARAISGHPLLREVSEEAARAARFSPTSVKGQPVKVSGILIYNFVP
jgi:TonB family protein